jgi:hypothetical protein
LNLIDADGDHPQKGRRQRIIEITLSEFPPAVESKVSTDYWGAGASLATLTRMDYLPDSALEADISEIRLPYFPLLLYPSPLNPARPLAYFTRHKLCDGTGGRDILNPVAEHAGELSRVPNHLGRSPA